MPSPNPILQYLVEGYRANENIPMLLNRADVLNMANGIKIALDQGMPVEGRDLYVKKLLLEGRVDAGTNEYNYNNPRAKQLFDKVKAAGASTKPAMYAAAVLDKLEVAKRLNIPFELAWNGTGRSVSSRGVVEADGQRHAERAKLFENVAKDPRNADLVELVNRVTSSGPTDQEAMLMLGSGGVLDALLGGPPDKNSFYAGKMSKWKDIMENMMYKNLPEKARQQVREDLDLDKMGTYRMLLENIRFDIPKNYPKSWRGSYTPPELPQNPATRSVVEALAGVDNSFATYKAANSMRYPPGPPPQSLLESVTDILNSLFKSSKPSTDQ